MKVVNSQSSGTKYAINERLAIVHLVHVALKFCFKTCVAMKFVDDDDDDDAI